MTAWANSCVRALIRARISDAVRRLLAAGPLVGPGLLGREGEAPAEQRLEGGPALVGVPVRLRVLGVGRPVGAGPYGLQRLVEGVAMALGQGQGGEIGGQWDQLLVELGWVEGTQLH
jgi:hypothetical protein